MKLTKYLYAIAVGVVSASFTACENAENNFPDFEGGFTVYFANQYPVRTIVLGNDEYNSLDLQHKCAIYATQSGGYHGKKGVVLDIAVDNSLCDNLYFTDETGSAAEPVAPMPTSYYTLSGNQINLNEMDNFMGAVEVQLTDAFFADPKAIGTTYVIPVVITGQKGADHILTGEASTEGANPSRTDADQWKVLPKDYTLYCVKYINPWHSDYIRRGVDNVTENGKTTQVVRRDVSMMESDPEHNHDNPVNANDEVVEITTRNMTQAIFPVAIKNSGASKLCDLVLTFNGNDCTISCDDEGVKANGSGKYITEGTKDVAFKDFIWGAKERDILCLQYSIDFGDVQVQTNDTLVVRSRGTNKKVTFTPIYNK